MTGNFVSSFRIMWIVLSPTAGKAVRCSLFKEPDAYGANKPAEHRRSQIRLGIFTLIPYSPEGCLRINHPGIHCVSQTYIFSFILLFFMVFVVMSNGEVLVVANVSLTRSKLATE